MADDIHSLHLWVNRMLGDEQLPIDIQYSSGTYQFIREWPEWLTNPDVNRTSGRYTFVTLNHWGGDKKNSPLLPSGLLGPVTIQTSITSPTSYTL